MPEEERSNNVLDASNSADEGSSSDNNNNMSNIHAKYCIELARAAHGNCHGKKNGVTCRRDIPKGSLHAGSFDFVNFGTYGFWEELACWRVPNDVWQELERRPGACRSPAEMMHALQDMKTVVQLDVDEFSEADKQRIFKHLSDRTQWAKFRAKRQNVAPAKKPEAPEFDVPVPGKDGAVPHCFAGFVFANTGKFPKLRGGDGLKAGNLKEGKKRLAEMISSFGGTVVQGSPSSKTDYLIVGEEPGLEKFFWEGKGGKTVTLDGLLAVIEGRESLSHQNRDSPEEQRRMQSETADGAIRRLFDKGKELSRRR